MATTTTTTSVPRGRGRAREDLVRRAREFRRLADDPVLLIGVLTAVLFILLFVVWPLVRVIWQGLFPATGGINVEEFRRYADPFYGPAYREALWNTMIMGVGTATGSTLLGFLFAYAIARCDMPFRRGVHLLALLPTISPPFAISIAAILLFGRNGFVTAKLLGINYGPGMNDIYGLDGLVFVQIITFFSVAYLILRGMLERLDPSMEEAAQSLGASRWHIFRTVTLPLLVPGFASAFMLLFVESLADLANPLLIAGSKTVLASQIWVAVAGEHDQVKAAALSVVLLAPTLLVFILQRYWVSRRSYVSVTGKPTGGHLGQDPRIRWTFITLTTAASLLILALYGMILIGSLTKVWGVDYSLDLRHYSAAINRGLKSILDTTYLSAVATPIAGLLGMLAAWLIVRRSFSGRESLDFVSNLGGAVPGTILGVGYIIAFIVAPMGMVTLSFGIIAACLVALSVRGWARRLGVIVAGLAVGYLLTYLPVFVLTDDDAWHTALALIWVALGAGLWLAQRRTGRAVRPLALLVMGMGVYIWLGVAITWIADPLAVWGRTLDGSIWPKVVDALASHIQVPFQVPLAMLGLIYGALALLVTTRLSGWTRLAVTAAFVALTYVMTFTGAPLALVGTPYIILAAYAVRSLPASERAGIAQLQQIDPAIEEASTSLGADAGVTFRRVTLPLILPAFLAGLIFAFARHMTSLSAIIFLTTAKWPILTALILSEVEQGGMSLAAAYSMILIFIVLGAIGIMELILRRTLGQRGGGIDLTLGAG